MCDGRMPSEKCTFRCDDGYNVVGNSELTCLEDGTWEGEIPECVISCPPGYGHDDNATTCVILECDPLVCGIEIYRMWIENFFFSFRRPHSLEHWNVVVCII